MFRCFSNLWSLDLCWLRLVHAHIHRYEINMRRNWREITPPGPLFPSLRSLRLSGCMSLDFVSSVVESQKNYLQHLDLNNLFEWSKIDPPLPRLSHLRDLSLFIEANASNLKISLNKLPMLGHIDPLVDHLDNLKVLRIGTVGRIRTFSEGPHNTSVYASWARLLDAVRPTLEEFYFDQGYNRNNHASGARPRSSNRPTPIYREMDELFIKNILPVLLEAPWPRIRRMHIRGVGRRTTRRKIRTKPTKEQLSLPDLFKVIETGRDETQWYLVEQTIIAVPMQIREDIRGLLKGGHHGGVDFVFDEEQGRDWEDPLHGDTGIPEYDQP